MKGLSDLPTKVTWPPGRNLVHTHVPKIIPV